jgi:cob(I)alamin adenosyltransferase
MGNRLSKIVTRTGDTGTTGLGDGSRVQKDSPRVEAIGSVDELNSLIGLLNASPGLPASISQLLLRVQHDLFDLGGELAVPGHTMIGEEHVRALEADLERLHETLPPLREFILPGGSEATARCHVARTAARRTERRCWKLAASETISELPIVYLNRLSDLLFVLARVLARETGAGEVLWNRKRFEA